MEPECSLPYSHMPATCPYHEPDQSSPCPPIPLPEDPSYYCLPIYAWVSKVVSFPHVSPPNPCTRLSFLPYVLHAPPTSFSSIFFTRTILDDDYRTLSSSLCIFLHFPASTSLLGLNVFLYTLFWDTLSLRLSLNAGDAVSHPYVTTGKIIVLYIFIFICLVNKQEFQFMVSLKKTSYISPDP